MVVGGGNTAIDAAVAARRLGADEVRMVYRRGEKEMPAFAFEFGHARQEGVRFEFHTTPLAIRGGPAVRAVECVRMALGEDTRGSRTLSQPVPGSNFVIECDMVITSIGQTKLMDLLAQYRGVQLDGGPRGHHSPDRSNQQSALFRRRRLCQRRSRSGGRSGRRKARCRWNRAMVGTTWMNVRCTRNRRLQSPRRSTAPSVTPRDTYELKWLVRKKIDRLPGHADERAKALFKKVQSYMVLLDDKAMCKNMRCRKRFDVSGIKTTAFI